MRGPDAARALLDVEPVPAPRAKPVVRATAVTPALELVMLWTDAERLPDAIAALRSQTSSHRRREEPTEAQDGARWLVRRGSPCSLPELELRVRDTDGTPPYALVAGTMTLSFDVRAELETTVALCRPFAVQGEALQRELAHAEAVLETPVEGAPEVARGLCERIQRAWRDTSQRRAAYDLRQATRRVLLTQRAYTRLGVFGETCLQAELGDGRDRSTVYLPEVVADVMPLFPELDVRLVVSLHARQDASVTTPLALRAVAVARVA